MSVYDKYTRIVCRNSTAYRIDASSVAACTVQLDGGGGGGAIKNELCAIAAVANPGQRIRRANRCIATNRLGVGSRMSIFDT